MHEPRNIHATTYQRYEDIPISDADGTTGTLGSRKSDTVLRYNGRRFGLGTIPEGFLVNQGEHQPRRLAETPEAYSYGLSICIDNYGGTAAESRRLQADGLEHEVEDGDFVIFDNDLVFVVAPHRQWGRIDPEFFDLDWVGHYGDL